MKMIICILGSVAQLVEHRPVAARVIGSTPFCSAHYIMYMTMTREIKFLVACFISILVSIILYKHLITEYCVYCNLAFKVELLKERCLILEKDISLLEVTLSQIKENYSVLLHQNECYLDKYKVSSFINLTQSIVNVLILCLGFSGLLIIGFYFYQDLMFHDEQLADIKGVVVDIKNLLVEADDLFQRITPVMNDLPATTQQQLQMFWSSHQNAQLIIDRLVVDSSYAFATSSFPVEFHISLYYFKNFLLYVLIPVLKQILIIGV